MKKKEKDYLVKTLLLQFFVCLIMFVVLLGFKSANYNLFFAVEDMFSDKLEENLSSDEAVSVFQNIKDSFSEEPETEAETEYIPLEEPSLSAEIIASGGKDIKVNSEKEIPENVSVHDYKLSQQMVLPLKGKTTSEFGVRTHPISGDLRFHAGIDIAADEGENIYSAFDGEVIEASFDKWNGNYLKIKHDNNIMTVYCHCKELNVKKGQVIRGGEVVGTVGSTGSSTGPHLHFELRINNISYNPQKAISEAKNAI